MNASHTNALKGQRAASPGPLDLWSLARQERPGYSGQPTFALKGQKHHTPTLGFGWRRHASRDDDMDSQSTFYLSAGVRF